MLFFNGRKDGLFPVDGVEAAYVKLHAVWDSQHAGNRLATRVWDVGHVFNADMQDAVFAWLDEIMADIGKQTATPPPTARRRRLPDSARKRKPAPDQDVAPSPTSDPAPTSATKPEITWLLMHPVKPDVAYMRAVIAAAAQYHVDSFEICGDVHCNGNIDGAIRFRDYPGVGATSDCRNVDDNVRLLREVVALAHASGRPVYYWHREVMVPRVIVEKVPGLLDENGEFDLLGDAYHTLVRSKIREFFDNVPEMDGLVLTLTESDYSVIHNSDPKRYPPAEVVKRIVETFASELRARGKRFILRSFGSIAQDYDDILAGAEQARTEVPFEIETKVTPYDFSPFLPMNPYLRRTGRCTLSAEYDSIGEFLSAGFLPAADPARVIQTVDYARRQGVSRHVIRVDRIGHATFLSTQAINLLAFDRAIREPDITADAVWREWAVAHWPQCPDEMTGVMRGAIEMVKKTHFISGNVIFHAFPIQPDLKWVKAGGILSTFSPGTSLAVHPNMWGILSDRTTPSRAGLRREKDEAVAMADEGLRAVLSLRDRLPESEFRLAESAWQRATIATRAIRAWCQCLAAYFEDMEQGRADHPALSAAFMAAETELARLQQTSTNTEATTAAKPAGSDSGHEYGDDHPVDDTVEAAYVRPIQRHIETLAAEYDAEFHERSQWRARAGVVDYVVCGGLLDDIRVDRPMHASHARLINGRPVRFVGNRVFPNGSIEMRLRQPVGRAARLVVLGEAGGTRQFKVEINGVTRTATFSSAGEFTCDLEPAATTADIIVRIQKQGADYPAVYGVGTLAP
jgi:hypothetical protein